MVDEAAAMPWLSPSMRIDERIVAFLLGEESIDARIARSASSWATSGFAEPRATTAQPTAAASRDFRMTLSR